MNTVLNEIAVAARGLTGARYAVIITIDDAGQLEDYVMSGFSPAEERQVSEWPAHMQIFEQLRDLQDQLRVADMPAYQHAGGSPGTQGASASLPSSPPVGPAPPRRCLPAGGKTARMVAHYSAAAIAEQGAVAKYGALGTVAGAPGRGIALSAPCKSAGSE